MSDTTDTTSSSASSTQSIDGMQGWIVSVKGVLVARNHVALAMNNRDEWELPGGRVDPTDASPAAALIREMQEELGVDVTVTDLLDTYIFEPVAKQKRLIITYRCEAEGLPELRRSSEHAEVAWIALDALHEINLPGGYWRSINGL